MSDPDELIDRLLKAHGRWLLMATLMGIGDATKDDDRLARAEYADARAAVAWRMKVAATPAPEDADHGQA